MEFRISEIFTDSLTRLTADIQKAVKATGFDMQLNPAVLRIVILPHQSGLKGIYNETHHDRRAKRV